MDADDHGTVTLDGVPIITLQIAGREWRATIDTGFNGYLELPDVLLRPLNPQYIGQVTSILAGGQSIEEELYQVNFLFDDREIFAEATFVDDSDILIGTQLLRDYCLTINFVMRTVAIERVN